MDSYPISVGDRIMVHGPTTGVIEETVKSMQIEHEEVTTVTKGNSVGVKLEARVKPNDKVFLLEAETT